MWDDRLKSSLLRTPWGLSVRGGPFEGIPYEEAEEAVLRLWGRNSEEYAALADWYNLPPDFEVDWET